jgi:damage-control phosphatase, subfamily III
METFRSSQPSVLELAARYQDLMQQLDPSQSRPRHASGPGQAEFSAGYMLFSDMCEVCLWGNATDLSLLTELSYEDIQKLQGSEARKSSQKNILVNDLPTVYNTLQSSRQELGNGERRIDIILDNAGFELFVDLILAGYLIASDLATKVVFHPKSIPWFVSDVLPVDFDHLLEVLVNPQSFYGAVEDRQPLSSADAYALQNLGRQWKENFANGRFGVENNRSWTGPGSYWRIPKTEPELYKYLQDSELVIFKADLNYRKLTGDVGVLSLSGLNAISTGLC